MKTIPFALALLCLASAQAAETSASPQAVRPYPLKTCVVSGEELGAMGDPYVHSYTDEAGAVREVRLCCKSCLKKFVKNPAKYLEKLDKAAATPASPSTPVATHSTHRS